MLVTYVTKIAPFPSLMQLGNGANLRIARQEISCATHDNQSCGINHAHIFATDQKKELSYLTKKVRERIGERLVAHMYKNNFCGTLHSVW